MSNRFNNAAGVAFQSKLAAVPRPLSRADFDDLKSLFYALPGNEAGGSLHVVLDDCNWERDHVQFCYEYASELGDFSGAAFARALLELTDDQLRDYCGAPYCCTCKRDIEPLIGEVGCECGERRP